jgi:hypothetical protein
LSVFNFLRKNWLWNCLVLKHCIFLSNTSFAGGSFFSAFTTPSEGELQTLKLEIEKTSNKILDSRAREMEIRRMIVEKMRDKVQAAGRKALSYKDILQRLNIQYFTPSNSSKYLTSDFDAVSGHITVRCPADFSGMAIETALFVHEVSHLLVAENDASIVKPEQGLDFSKRDEVVGFFNVEKVAMSWEWVRFYIMTETEKARTHENVLSALQRYSSALSPLLSNYYLRISKAGNHTRIDYLVSEWRNDRYDPRYLMLLHFSASHKFLKLRIKEGDAPRVKKLCTGLRDLWGVD